MGKFDVCGIICICLMYGAIVYADYAYINWMIRPVLATSLWGVFNVAVFNIILVLAIYSHSRATFGDPGMVPLPKTHIDFSTVLQHQNNSDWTICARCETYRPPYAHHCRTCNRCIRRMDHHCPWINNCVGELNQKYFMQFLVYTGLACIYGAGVVGVSWYLEEPVKDPMEKLSEYKQNRLIHTVVFLVECILFGLFSLVIFCDQVSSVMNGPEGGKKDAKRSKSCRSSMRDVCGRGALWTWAVPCTAPPHSDRSSYEV